MRHHLHQNKLMFGYVTPDKAALSPQQEARYRSLYCGLCDALRERHGALSRFMLNYDTVFLALLLNSLYEPETTLCTRRCAAHPFCAREHLQSEYTLYAADMTAVLFYHKCLDDAKDDRSLRARIAARLLRRSYDALYERYPAQCGAISESLKRLERIEASPGHDPDGAARCFGELLAAVFVKREDMWSNGLRAFAQALGEFIYIMDAWDDAPRDAKRKRFNPLLELYGRPDFDARAKDILTLLMARAAAEFEKLPLVEDIALMRNVLYSGVWMKYELKTRPRKRAKREGRRKNADIGSI